MKKFWFLQIGMSLLLGSITLFCYGQNGEWLDPGPPNPRLKYNSSSCVYNGKIFVFGGYHKPAPTRDCQYGSNTVEVYDPILRTWDTTRSNIPTFRSHTTVEVLNDRMYLIGGTSGFPDLNRYASIEVYDPINDKWLQSIPLSDRRWGCESCIIDDKIYILGGFDDHNIALSCIDVYDPKSKRWGKKAAMPAARGSFSAEYINGKIYAIGGYTGQNVWDTIQRQSSVQHIDIYDVNSNSWSTASYILPHGLTSLTTVIFNNLVYIAGGYISNPNNLPGRYSEYMLAIDPNAEKTYKICNLPLAGGQFNMELLGEQFTMLGGINGPPGIRDCEKGILNVNYTYKPVFEPIIVSKAAISTSFLKSSDDSLMFSTSFNKPLDEDFSAEVIIINDNGETIYSDRLYDDGQHADFSPNDEIFGNCIKGITDEGRFQINVKVSNRVLKNNFTSLNTTRRFTTIGPIEIDTLYHTFQGDTLTLDISLKNHGKVAPAKDISIELFSTNPGFSLLSKNISYGDINPGQVKKSLAKFLLIKKAKSTETEEINLVISILSEGISFWNYQSNYIINNVK